METMSISRHASWKVWGTVTRAALIAASVAIFSGTASAAVQQTLTSNHVGAYFGTAPQVDSSGNVWTLMDSGDTTYLMKFQPDGSILKSVPMPNPFVHNGCHLLVDSSNNVYLDTWEDDRPVATIVIVRKFELRRDPLVGAPQLHNRRAQHQRARTGRADGPGQ